jgi:hypothetical protein
MKKQNPELQKVWRQSADLAKEFINKCMSSFDFLTNNYGFECETGLLDFSSPKGELKKIPDELSHAFLCIVRFKKDPLKIELSYGDREFLIEGRIWYNLRNEDDKYGLWEILNAANIDYDDISGKMWVSSSDFLSRTIDSMANSFKMNTDLFVKMNPQIIEKALILRDERLKNDIRTQRLQGLERARNIANEKFKARKYKETIETLMQFCDMLSAADKAKIKLAEKKLEQNEDKNRAQK